MFNNRNKKEEENLLDMDDRLIIYESDGHNCEIHYITEISDEAVICAGRAVVPKEDCHVSMSAEGRVWLYNAPKEHVHEVERLAKLEKSIVLRQMTSYNPEKPVNPNTDLRFWAMAFLFFVEIIAVAV